MSDIKKLVKRLRRGKLAYTTTYGNVYERATPTDLEAAAALEALERERGAARAATPHHYWPSAEHMGDCRICGNVADHPNHDVDFKARAESAEAEVARLREALEAERTAIASKARFFADFYPTCSDGRNTFILFAEWIEDRAALSEGKVEDRLRWFLSQAWSAQKQDDGQLRPGVQISGNGISVKAKFDDQAAREMQRFWLEEYGRIKKGDPFFYIETTFILDEAAPSPEDRTDG